MSDLDAEWELFQNQLSNNNLSKNIVPTIQTPTETVIPKCSDIYISTQTKIAYLNQPIKLEPVFWNLPIINYYSPTDGIIKKSIKINSNTPEQVTILEKKIKEIPNLEQQIISQVNNPNARKIKFKDVRKIDIGLCKKDLTSYRKKKKGAFYNCFAIILRLLYNKEYKEVHVKIFNTGKLEIPGIQYDDLLIVTLNKLIDILKPLTNNNIDYYKENIQTVLINSNFSCGFFVDRFKLYEILKTKYHISAGYDPCSYPGIQCKFYYNKYNKEHKGYKLKENKEQAYKDAWKVVSFMIFRTGSVLIVGNCDSNVLHIIYKFLKNVLKTEYNSISIKNNLKKKKVAVKKIRKKTILFSVK